MVADAALFVSKRLAAAAAALLCLATVQLSVKLASAAPATLPGEFRLAISR